MQHRPMNFDVTKYKMLSMGKADGEGSTRELSSRRASGGRSPRCRGKRMLMTNRDTWWLWGRGLAPARPRYTSI